MSGLLHAVAPDTDWEIPDPEHVPASATLLLLYFVVLSLVMLFLVPFLIGQHRERLHEDVDALARPAHVLLDDIELALSRSMAVARGFLLTGDNAFVEQFEDSRTDADLALARLVPLARELGGDVEHFLVAFSTQRDAWEARYQAVFDGQVLPDHFIDEIPASQDDYEGMVRTARQLHYAIDRAVAEHLAGIRTLERWGAYLTGFLASMALLSVTLVLWLGRRLRTLARALEQRVRAETALRRTAHTLATAHDQTDVLQSLVDNAFSLTPVDGACVVYLHLEPQDTWRLFLPREQPSSLPNDLPTLTLARQAVSDVRRPAMLAGTVPGAAASGTHQPGRRYDVVVAPLFAGSTSLGALVLYRRARRTPFSHDEHRRVQILMDVASLALREALLFEQERMARIAAERAKQAREDVLGIVSHDLKSPLSVISMAAHLMSTPVPRGILLRQVDLIKRSSNQMSRLLEDLMDVTRLESGQVLHIDLALIPVRSLVEEAGDAFDLQLKRKDLRFTSCVADDMPDLTADRGRLLQVLYNLLGNAVKFTPEGGEVALRAERCDGEALFSVRDSGPGLAADDASHVFDPYWQAKHTARLGSGLGLPIAKGIVEAHGGRIWVESVPGTGSTFYFTIPVDAPPHTPATRGSTR